MANTLQHVLHDCIRWAEVDIGPDPTWKELFPAGPGVLWCEGACPQTVDTASGIDSRPTGSTKGGRLFLQVSFSLNSSIFYGTDASGGPRGLDPRLRVVSWAVVAIRLRFDEPSVMSGLIANSMDVRK